MSPSRLPVPPVHRVLVGFARLLRAEVPTVRQSMSALALATVGNLAAGLALGAMTNTLQRLPGLMILVPAAIGMRGNIFGALGSRLGTAIHTGQFSMRRRGLVSENITAAAVLTICISFALALLATGVGRAMGIATMSVVDMVVVSVLGGVLSSVVVLLITLATAILSTRRDWDMDNVAAPIVTASGDMVTLPTLWAATFLLHWQTLIAVLGWLAAAAAAASLVWAFTRHGRPVMHRILAESLPILLVAGTVDVLAGLTIEHRIVQFLVLPALLVMVPSFLADAGALGGILSARITSKLHLGAERPTGLPGPAVLEDILLIYLYALPLFGLVGVSASLAALVTGLAGPGVAAMVAVALVAGLMSTTTVVLVAYYGAVVTFRFGLDPDNHGIPLVTSSMDLVGVLSLIVAFGIVGVA